MKLLVILFILAVTLASIMLSLGVLVILTWAIARLAWGLFTGFLSLVLFLVRLPVAVMQRLVRPSAPLRALGLVAGVVVLVMFLHAAVHPWRSWQFQRQFVQAYEMNWGEPPEIEGYDAEDSNAEQISLPADVSEHSSPVVSRPEWTNTPSRLAGDVYQLKVVSDPYLTKRECDEALQGQMVTAAAEYIDECLDQPGAAATMRINQRFVRKNLLGEEWVETLNTSVGPMQRVHARLDFSEAVRHDLRHQWRESVRTKHLAQLGWWGASVLACVGIALGYLRFDTATRGFYTRRLQWAAGTAILVVLIAAVALTT